MLKELPAHVQETEKNASPSDELLRDFLWQISKKQRRTGKYEKKVLSILKQPQQPSKLEKTSGKVLLRSSTKV